MKLGNFKEISEMLEIEYCRETWRQNKERNIPYSTSMREINALEKYGLTD